MSIPSITHHLSDPTRFFGLRIWMTMVICILLLIVVLFFVILCSSFCRRRRRRRNSDKYYCLGSRRLMDRRLLSRRAPEGNSVHSDRSNWSRNKFHLVDMPPATATAAVAVVGGGNGIQLANNGFSHGSVERRVIYRGDEKVEVNVVINSSYKVEEFLKEVEVIWGIRHNNLVKLIGSSYDGTKRTLVYEYVDNCDLHQWLHQCVATINPLTWDIRMGIILGIAKGLAYLHEDSEPKVIHQCLKSSNILLDRQWNPKISNVGITKFLGPQQNLSGSCNLIEMSGYLDPEYVSAHNFNEKTDVYSFGVLVMEIISGRTPIRYVEPNTKEYLLDWLKLMVRDERFDEIVDQRLQEPPLTKELKRIILIALRCVDPDVENRPTMGEIIHMLEPRDLLLDDEYVMV